jgi:hypothetical protein
VYQGWRLVGDDRYTCVAPVGYEKDPAVTAAIRAFDPGVIPIWRIQVWVAPDDPTPRQHVHHGFARFYPHPRRLRRGFACPVPADWRGEAPNFLDFIMEDQETRDFHRGGPGGFIPWDWALYTWARRHFDRLTVKLWLAAVERRQERDAKIRQAWQDDLEYRKKQLEPYLLRRLAGASPTEWKQYEALMHAREVAKQMGRKPPSVREKKVFVDVGRSPRLGATYGRVAPSQELSKA